MGFIPAQGARDNTTKLLNPIQVATATKPPCVFLSTDAEKALDRVSWVFIPSVLKQIGLGHKMLQWISSSYFTPTAQVKVNGILSDSFPIKKWYQTGMPTLAPSFCPSPGTPLMYHMLTLRCIGSDYM